MTEISVPPPPPLPSEQPWYFRNWAVALGFVLGLWPGFVLLAARPPRTRKKTWWSLGAGVASFLIFGVLPDSSTSETAKVVDTTSPETTVKKWTYKDHLKPAITITTVWDESCPRVRSVVKSKDSKYKSLLKTGNKYVVDPWDSSGLIQKVSWWGGSDTIANAFALVAKELQPGYMKAVDLTSSGATSEVSPDYVSDFIDHCKLKQQYSSLESNAISLQSLRLRVQSSASNIPWHPKGYTEYSTGLAWKWERASCSYGDQCWSMSVISLTGCSTLYVAITILDSADNNIGYNNDLAQGVRAGQRTLLRFEDFTPGASSARLSEINCY